MVTREHLLDAGLRAYELGRLRQAARVGLVLAPMGLVCALESGNGETCACLTVGLFAAAIFLRWRNREGSQSVALGLVAGGALLSIGLLIARLAAPWWTGPLSRSTEILFACGVIAGAWISSALGPRQRRLARALPAAGIAVVVACLGTLRLGPLAAASAGLGLLSGVGIAMVIAALWGKPK